MDIRHFFKKDSKRQKSYTTELDDVGEIENACETTGQPSEDVLRKEGNTPSRSSASVSETETDEDSIPTVSEAGPSCAAHPSVQETGRHFLGDHDTPNHEKPSSIPPQKDKSRTLCFQKHWYNRFPWLHFSP